MLLLPPEQMLVLARLAEETPEGYGATTQSASLADSAGVTSDEARRVILVVDYLYERCRNRNIALDAAIEELTAIASELEIEEIADRAAALNALLSPKDLYETKGRTGEQARSVVPHFIDFDGVWDIRPLFHRETGAVANSRPVLLVSFSWHDDAGTAHNASFQLDDEDWALLRQKMDELSNQRSELGKYMERL